MQVGDVSHGLHVYSRVFADLVDMADSMLVGSNNNIARECITYRSNIVLMFVPMVLLYTSLPVQVRSRFKEQISRLKGLAQIMAALNSLASPSSPRYCF